MASGDRLLIVKIIPLFVAIGCAHPEPESEPVTDAHAHAVSDNLLRGLQNDDYAEFSRDFTPELAELFDQQAFDDLQQRVISNCGGFVSVDAPISMPNEPPELRFETDAVFDAENVHIWLWFDEYDPRLKRLWLDAPGLHAADDG